jgi:hypothetical protein
MKRLRSKRQDDFEFAVRFGGSSLRLRLHKPDKQTSTRLVKWVLTLLLALLILLAPELWQAIQRALAVIH